MKFQIQQIALAINRARETEALALLKAIGIEDWVSDTAHAKGKVLGELAAANEAKLMFNYTALGDARELELLQYTRGANWLMHEAQPRASHFGMHVTEEELTQWRALLAVEHKLPLVQEVFTQSHSNPEIAGKRWYHYAIFGARHLIGIDLKFIVRRSEL